MGGRRAGGDVLCLSHLGWGFVDQRPQHLMRRCAAERRVFYVERAVETDGPPALSMAVDGGVHVVNPALPPSLTGDGAVTALRGLVDGLVADVGLELDVLWYYWPLTLGFTGHLDAAVTVYDCMDKIGSFSDALPGEEAWERRLLDRADVVFTGGRSLYEDKRADHANVHCFPSSVDRGHFAQARDGLPEPDDQRPLPRPRLGWFGVIEERVDLDLLADVADARPDWQIVMVGPVVRVDPDRLPRRDNIHWVGRRSYAVLPAYLGGWDVAIMPFAANPATEFISPTKTLEYLAGGRPVVSTPVRDVVSPYGDGGLVEIAFDAPSFVAAVERVLDRPAGGRWLEAVDETLRRTSWDRTWRRMWSLIEKAAAR